MTYGPKFTATFEDILDSDKYNIVVELPLYPNDGKKHTEFIYYPPQFLPTEGQYLTARYTISLSVTKERRGTETSVDETVSTCEFSGRIFGFKFSNQAFELSNSSTGEIVAQIQLHPDHLPDWLSDKGDTCYISIRLEYDHERMLDYDNDAEIEKKRAQFQEQVAEMEEYIS